MSNNTFRNLLGVAITIFFGQLALAQISQGGQSLLSQGKIPALSSKIEQMPTFNVSEMLAEDQVNLAAGKQGQYRFGKEFSVSLNLNNSGLWTELANGDRVWQLRIQSQNATSLNFILNKFRLAGSSQLFLYTADQKNFLGGFTAANNNKDEVFGTAPLPGGDVSLELFEPASARGLNQLQIGTVVHGYKSTFAFGDAGNCHININCPIAWRWKDQGESVALIVDGGGLCTGSMVNNELEDGTPFFLTANHCYSNRVPSWVFVFDFEAPTCPDPATAPSMSKSVTGSVLRARSSASDFCLLQLNTRPPASYGVYFNGWDALGNAPDSGVGIHHPAGDIMKISYYTGATTSFNGNPRSENWLLSWLLNTATEGGSSGSPLFDQNQRVVGQLYGGGSACGNTLTDYYGKFSVSWDRTGATRTNRLKDWLDPNSDNNRLINGSYSECLIPVRPFPITQSFDSSQFLPAGYSVSGVNSQYQWSVLPLSGSNNVMRANPLTLNGTPATTRLNLPAFNAKGKNNIKISFKYAYALSNQTQQMPPRRDSLRLLVSTDCGKNYSPVWIKNDTNLVTTAISVGNFIPSVGEWKEAAFILDSLVTWNNAIYLLFEAASNGGGNIYLDSINIGGGVRPRKPLARISLVNNGGCSPATVFAIDSSLFNASRVLWKAPGATVDTSTSRTPQFFYNNPGVYPLTLIAFNDNGVDSVRIRRAVIIGSTDSVRVPYAENFDNLTRLPTNWLVRNNNSDTTWRISNTGTTASGRSMRMSNFSGGVTGDFAFSFLPKMNLGSIQNALIEFDYAYIRRNAATDTLYLGYSTDCGATWTSFWKRGGTNLATVTGSQNFSGFVPTANQWRNVSVTIPANVTSLGSVRLALVCRSGGGQNLYIDNLGVRDGSCPGRPNPTFDSDCMGGTLNFSTPSVPNATYLWTGPNGYLSSLQNPTIQVLDSTYLGAYNLVVTVNNCSSEAGSVNVIGKPSPPKPILVKVGDSLRLRSYIGGAISWSMDGITQAGYRDTLFPLFGTAVYQARVQLPNGCFILSDPLTFNIVGEAIGHSSGLMQVYPNPATTNVEVPNFYKEFVLSDVLGRPVPMTIEKSANKIKLNLEKVTPGIYLLNGWDFNGKKSTVRLVKE